MRKETPVMEPSLEEHQVAVKFQVNGKTQQISVDVRATLLDALRENLQLTGTKKGCDHGQCGACTVLVDGVRINSCLTLAVMQEGREITTIEGLAGSEGLHPVQVAFLEHDGFQCGYCTPGQIMSAAALLHEPVEHSEESIRENMSGNLCRCGAYPNIVKAVMQALEVQEKGARMNSFRYTRTETARQALEAARGRDRAFVAGGTTILDLMKLEVEQPAELIDINRLPLAEIEELPDGGVRIGALARNSQVAHHELIGSRYPVLREALLSGASPQLRNMATVGGNILQRTRCYYFRDPLFDCNKRVPGSGCPAMEEFNRIHAILGGSEHCIATNPSDMNVALAALDSVVHVDGPRGSRAIPFEQFHLLPGNTPERETVLEPGELITSVEIPASGFAANSLYLKLRDRASYEFALVSVAIALEVADGRIRAARVAFGGVATKPWRAHNVEAVLTGARISGELMARAGEAAIEGARPRRDNGFKVELLRRAMAKALRSLLERMGKGGRA